MNIYQLLSPISYLMYVGILSACMSVYHMHVVPVGSRRRHQIRGTGVGDNCEFYGPGIKPGSSGSASSVGNHGTISEREGAIDRT